MNKTIIININGIVFHIEEDAYEVIRQYMTDVKRHFAYSQDSEEIVTDIENRLSEMFTERLAQENKQVIVLQDVQEVTAQMGQVSDFATDDEDGNYTGQRVEKKLFRDIDDRVIGGVCSGIGHYFDIEARWIRVLFLLVVFLGGAGIMAYIILWIVMPKADTRAEKMAMKGEAINLQNFKKNFDEEVEALRHNFNHAATEAKPALQKLGSFVRDLIHHFLNFLGGAGKIIVKIIGLIIVLAGGMALLGLIIALFTTLGFWHSNELDAFPLNIINPQYREVLYVSVFLLIFIPLIALVLFAIRVIFNRAIVTKSASFGMLVLWIIGLSLTIFYGSRVGSEFNEKASLSQTTNLKASQVYYLKLDGAKFLSHEDSIRLDIDSSDYNGRIIISGDDEDINAPSNFKLRVVKSDEAQPVLIQEYSARGRNFESALKTAQNIRYQFTQRDSVLQFNRRADLASEDLWRNQEVELTLKVPANTRLIIDTRLDRYFQDFYLWNCVPEGASGNVLTEWVMTNEGLKCKDDSLYKKKSGWDN